MRIRPVVILLCLSLLLSLSFLASCSGSAVSPPAPVDTPSPSTISDQTGQAIGKLLTISYIDVGQGDSILIQTPNGKTMLIDAGDTHAKETVAGYLRKKRIQRIDVLVATHPKKSHIAGMPYIIDNFEIGSFYMPDTALTNSAQDLGALNQAVKDKGLTVHTATAGITIELDSELSIVMIAPLRSNYQSSNDFSAVIKVVYGHTSFLFTGDATEISEMDMLDTKADVTADVLKIGHHGEATSSSMEFLQSVSPQYAIISVGADNWYGHPEQAMLDRLTRLGIQAYRTDLSGTVVITSDGQNILISTENDAQ